MATKPAKKSYQRKAATIAPTRAQTARRLRTVSKKTPAPTPTPSRVLKKSTKVVSSTLPLRQKPASKAAAERIVKKVFSTTTPTAVVLPGGSARKVATVRSRQSTAKVVAAISATEEPEVILERRVTAPIESKETVPTADSAIVLPSNLSERVLAKAEALTTWYQVRFPEYAARIATTAGSVFIVTSVLFLTQFVFAHYPSWDAFQRAALCSTGVCDTLTGTSDSLSGSDTSTPTADSSVVSTSDTGSGSVTSNTTSESGTVSATAIPSPKLEFLTKPPTELISVSNFILRAEYARDVKAFAVSRSSGIKYALSDIGATSGADYTFALDPARLPSGEYDLRVQAVAERDGAIIRASGPQFKVPAPVTTTTSTGSGSGTSATTSSITTTTTQTQSGTTSSQLTTEPSATTTQSALSLTLSRTGIPTTRLLAAQAREASFVELYAQRTVATQPYFVGLFKRVDATLWHYFLDTTNLPDGSYSLYARAKVPAGVVMSNRVTLEISNATRATTTSITEPITVTTAAVATAPDDSRTALPDRSEYLSTPTAPKTSTTIPLASADDDSSEGVSDHTETTVGQTAELQPRIVRSNLVDNEREINELLKRYASAYQSNDPTMQALVEEELTKLRERIVSETVLSYKGTTASEVTEQLESEFTRLKQRVETFETLLRERSKNQASADTDGDGVPDYDEITLYDTDPLLSDTDGDGVTDGVEVMRGFDPVDAKGEAVLAFASPKEFGLVRDDVLVVSEVKPIIETDPTLGMPAVQAEIRGKAIPNTFVTLFIYSTPVVVTVKAGADGTFIYQFDKELEDGAHEVYVALTDNTGAIIAKSRPFSFIKEAQAFTVTDESAGTIASTDPTTPIQSRELYQVVAAMAVLAFGLILLVLGMTMRREERAVDQAASAGLPVAY